MVAGLQRNSRVKSFVLNYGRHYQSLGHGSLSSRQRR